MRHQIYTASRGLVKTKRAVSMGVLGLAAAIIPTVMAITGGGASAASQVIVTPDNTQGWATADTRPGGAANIIADATAPGTPNKGALQLTTDATTAAKAQYLHAANTALADIAELSYQTKQNSASFPEAAASYQLTLCLTGITGASCNAGLTGTPNPTSFTTLVFEPYQNPTQGSVVPGSWQSWDVNNGLFWSSRTVVCENGTIVGASGGPATYTLSQVEAICPNAVANGFGVNIGTFNPSYDVEADLVNFNGTTYNFEPSTYVTVTIDKYLNGSKATTASANSTSFPMQSSWNSSNISAGSGTYTLGPVGFNSPNAYEAVTSNMVAGASYSTNEVTSGPVVATSCTTGGAPFALVGYTTGDTLAAAEAGTPSKTAPSFTDLQNDKYVIIWNKTCSTPTTKDQCMNDGWKSFDPTFKNQGDCVSFVATKGKNKPSGV